VGSVREQTAGVVEMISSLVIGTGAAGAGRGALPDSTVAFWSSPTCTVCPAASTDTVPSTVFTAVAPVGLTSTEKSVPRAVMREEMVSIR
jgi:hypothetical protein